MEQVRVSYTFEKCLGRGGYGEVYLATVVQPGGLTKKVAVKLLRPGIAREADALRRLRDEGRVLAMLDHPAILGVHEMTRIDGRVALVTEYVEGIDVSKCCKRGFTMPERAVVGIVGEVVAALHTAANTPSRETGKPLALIHRDIKPENIRLGKHGEVKLLDFGIARSSEMDREAETMAGSLPFTPGYAAPECFNEGLQHAPSDVYALGATAYRMLVAERLYEGVDTASQLLIVCARERYDQYLRKRLARVACDPRIRELVAEMLSFDPSARPTAGQVQQRCEALADELEGLTVVRWARGTQLTDSRPILDAELTGRTLEADEIVSVEVGRERAPRPASLPPPVPLDLSGSSIKPDTAPFARPRMPGSTVSPLSLDSLPIPDQGLQTLPPTALTAGMAADADTVLLPMPTPSDPPAPPPAPRTGGTGALLVKVGVVLFGMAAVGAVVVTVVVGALWMWVG